MTNISRDDLYQQVWSIPGSTLAKTYGVSETYLRKVCIALDVPRPPPGYWQQLAVGRILPRPPLPPRNTLRPSSWARASYGASSMIRPHYTRFDCSSAEHLERTARAMSRARIGWGEGYLRPRGRGILDLTVTPQTSTRALNVFERLASSLESRKHVLRVVPPGETLHRPTIDPRRSGDLKQSLIGNLWNPLEFTVVEVNRNVVRLSLYEVCCLEEMRYVGFGKYEQEAQCKEEEVYGDSWVEKRWIPAGKLELEAHLMRTDAPAIARWSEFQNQAAFGDTDQIVSRLEQLASRA